MVWKYVQKRVVKVMVNSGAKNINLNNIHCDIHILYIKYKKQVFMLNTI